jgi:cob(I)alamin adenosyltransferase
MTNPLREFIIPGITESDAKAHLCRSVCRKLERSIIKLVDNDTKPVYEFKSDENTEFVLKFINRLSDYFFALARVLSGYDLVRSTFPEQPPKKLNINRL